MIGVSIKIGISFGSCEARRSNKVLAFFKIIKIVLDGIRLTLFWKAAVNIN